MARDDVPAVGVLLNHGEKLATVVDVLPRATRSRRPMLMCAHDRLPRRSFWTLVQFVATALSKVRLCCSAASALRQALVLISASISWRMRLEITVGLSASNSQQSFVAKRS